MSAIKSATARKPDKTKNSDKYKKENSEKLV